MEKIEINTPDPDKVLPLLANAIEREKRLLSQSLDRMQKRIQALAAQLDVDPGRLMAGELDHPEEKDMDLLELEGEIELFNHLREQLERLEQLRLCSATT